MYARKWGAICAETGYPLKLPSPTNLARLGHFPPASQEGRLAGPVFYIYVFSLVETQVNVVSKWTNEKGPFLVGSWGLVVLVQVISFCLGCSSRPSTQYFILIVR